MPTRVITGALLLLLLVGLVAGITVGLPMFRETFTSIAVAAVNLSPGMQIRDGMVAMRMRRRDEVPEGAMFSLEALLGKYESERVTKDQPILPRQVTDATPPPMRRMPRRGYSIISFGVPSEDAANLFVGDRVDITVRFVDTSREPHKVQDPVTLRVGWPIYHID
jgi:Flp pilus assembly protein CpaB